MIEIQKEESNSDYKLYYPTNEVMCAELFRDIYIKTINLDTNTKIEIYLNMMKNPNIDECLFTVCESFISIYIKYMNADELLNITNNDYLSDGILNAIADRCQKLLKQYNKMEIPKIEKVIRKLNKYNYQLYGKIINKEHIFTLKRI